MTEPEKPAFLRKIEEEKKRLEAARLESQKIPDLPVPSDGFEKYKHLVPTPDYQPDPYGALFDNLSIIEAYRLWCGKMTPSVRPGQTESIMISCPIPGHKDTEPSAWVNTDSNTWYCGRCARGGDVYDLASLHYQMPDYKKGENFGKLRKAMAGALGYSVAKVSGRDMPYLQERTDLQQQTVVASSGSSAEGTQSASQTAPHSAPVIKPPEGTAPFQPGVPTPPVNAAGFVEKPETEEQLLANSTAPRFEIPTLNWKAVVKPGSFLDHYMKSTTIDDIAEEFHFWNGLLGIGIAGGRDVFLQDQPKVYGNLFVVLLGETGDGKSRSFRYMDAVLKATMPFDKPSGKGYKPIATPGSGEHMITGFMHPIYDVQNPKLIIGHAPIKSIVKFNEFEELVSKIRRLGSTLRNTVIDFYDCAGPVMSGALTSGDKIATDHFCSIFSTTQLESLPKLFEQNDASSGFMNRWVFASGKAKTQSFFSQQQVDLDPAIQAYREMKNWIGVFKKVTVSVEAIDLLEKFFKNTLHDKIKDPSGLYSRFSLLFKKLMLLLAINEKTDIVTAEIAQKVISLYPYLLAAYKVPEMSIGRRSEHDIVDEIARHIRRRSGEEKGTSKRDIVRLVARKKYTESEIFKAIKVMIDMDQIEEFVSITNGRPTTKYKWVGG